LKFRHRGSRMQTFQVVKKLGGNGSQEGREESVYSGEPQKLRFLWTESNKKGAKSGECGARSPARCFVLGAGHGGRVGGGRFPEEHQEPKGLFIPSAGRKGLATPYVRKRTTRGSWWSGGPFDYCFSCTTKALHGKSSPATCAQRKKRPSNFQFSVYRVQRRSTSA